MTASTGLALKVISFPRSMLHARGTTNSAPNPIETPEIENGCTPAPQRLTATFAMAEATGAISITFAAKPASGPTRAPRSSE
jgi:hypothetical protein